MGMNLILTLIGCFAVVGLVGMLDGILSYGYKNYMRHGAQGMAMRIGSGMFKSED